MLTKLLEQGRNQCAIYWPTHQGTPTLFGNIVVTLERVEHIAHYTIRTFNVKHSQQQQQPSRVIIQFQVSFRKSKQKYQEMKRLNKHKKVST